MSLLDMLIVSVQAVFHDINPNPTDEYFAELERLKIDVASESRNPADYQFLNISVVAIITSLSPFVITFAFTRVSSNGSFV